jgi:SAM-dependent methyltransferase
MQSTPRPTISDFANEVPPYYINALNDFRAFDSFEGKRVLEIGGSALPRRLVLDALGARQWVCVDIINHASGAYQQSAHAEHYASVGILPLAAAAPTLPEQPYVIFDGSADEIPPSFFEQFDVVFSINAFEHVLPLATVVERCHQALRPGGVLFSQFGPIWSCDVGSHFWVTPDFCFNAPGPMSPWAHLRFTRQELEKLLIEAGVDDDKRHHALYQVFESGFVNRRFFEEYEEVMAQSGFARKAVEGLWPRDVPADLQAQLEQLHPGRRDFASYGVRIVAHRQSLEPGRRHALRIEHPGLAAHGAESVEQASKAIFLSAARRHFGDEALSRLLQPMPPAAWPLFPWPDLSPSMVDLALDESVLRSASEGAAALSSGTWGAMLADLWLRAFPESPLTAVLYEPGHAVAMLARRFVQDEALAGASLSRRALMDTWIQHARRLLRLISQGLSIELVPAGPSSAEAAIEVPSRATLLHQALAKIASAGTASAAVARNLAAAALAADDKIAHADVSQLTEIQIRTQ